MKHLCVVIVTLLLSKTVVAQEASNDFGMQFNHVALSVSDLDASVSFYKNVLKLHEITNRTEKDGIRWFSLGQGKELHLISVVPGEISLNKAVHFALSAPKFDAFIANLKARNIKYSSWAGENQKITIRADGVKQVYIQDPDGYWIEINSAE